MKQLTETHNKQYKRSQAVNQKMVLKKVNVKKQKRPYLEYLKAGGWKGVVKTTFKLTGGLLTVGVIFFGFKFRQFMKDERAVQESTILIRQSQSTETSSQSYRPVKFTPKENSVFGQSVEFEFSENKSDQ